MKQTPGTGAFLVGERLYLREVRRCDVNETYYRWMNDPAVIGFLESRFLPNSMERLLEFVDEQRSKGALFLAIWLTGEDKHIGNIKVGPIDWIHRRAEVGLLIGEKDCWGKGYAAEAIRLVAAHAFRGLNLRRLTAGCYADNLGSIRAFEKAGFAREGVRKAHFFHGGGYVDEVLLGLIRDPADPASG